MDLVISTPNDVIGNRVDLFEISLLVSKLSIRKKSLKCILDKRKILRRFISTNLF